MAVHEDRRRPGHLCRIFKREKELTVSLTIVRNGMDLELDEVLPRVEPWFNGEHVLAGIISVEEGARKGQRHLQGVLRVMGTTVEMLRIEVGELLGWKHGKKNLLNSGAGGWQRGGVRLCSVWGQRVAAACWHR